MHLAISRFTNQINVVAETRNPKWDGETQVFIEVDDSTPATVQTPTGAMPLTEALWQRTGAFAYDPATDELVHDDAWKGEA